MNREPEPELMDLAEEAQAYAAADFADVNRAFVERLLELVGPGNRSVAVDLGTGPGDIPIRLAQARTDWRVVGVDASAAMLDIARQAVAQARLTGSIRLVLADAKRVALRARSADVICSNSILHHITETGLFWKEVARLARPGALLFLRDLARPADTRSAREIVEQYAGDESTLLQEEFYRSLLSAYTPDEVRAQLDRAGLTSLRVALSSDRHLDVTGRLPGV